MPKSKSRGKRYTPKGIRPNVLEWTMAGAHLQSDQKRLDLFTPVAGAVDALREGRASMEQWYVIDNGLRLSEALIELDIGNNLAPQIAAGRRALDAVGERIRKTGSSTCHALELRLIQEATDLYEVQLGLCTQGEMSRAVQRVRNIITSAPSTPREEPHHV
jgi:hypothetical protein